MSTARKSRLVSNSFPNNDPRLSPLDGKEAFAEWTIQRSQSILSCRSPSSGVLLTEITVQRATYVINGEDDDTRSVRWWEGHSLLETPNSRGNAESTLACHRKSFSCPWCARWTMARKHSRTNRPTSFPLTLFLSLSRFATCTLPRKYSTCMSVALHEAARSATRVTRQCLFNVFFFLRFSSWIAHCAVLVLRYLSRKERGGT